MVLSFTYNSFLFRSKLDGMEYEGQTMVAVSSKQQCSICLYFGCKNRMLNVWQMGYRAAGGECE